MSATRGLKKDSNRTITPAVEVVCVPAHLALPGSPQAKQLYHLHAELSLGQCCHRQKKTCVHVCRVTLVVSNSLQPYRLRPARLLCQGAQAVASPPHLALTEADPSPPGKPQEQTPVDDPHKEVEIKPQLKSRDSMAKEEDPKPCTRCRLNPHDQLGRLCVYEIYERPLRAPTKENALVLIAVDIAGKNT